MSKKQTATHDLFVGSYNGKTLCKREVKRGSGENVVEALRRSFECNFQNLKNYYGQEFWSQTGLPWDLRFEDLKFVRTPMIPKSGYYGRDQFGKPREWNPGEEA